MSNRPLQTGKAFALSALGPHGVAWWLKLIFVGMALSLHQPATAEEPQRILPQGIPGTLWLAGGGEFPSELRETFCKLAGAKEAKLVIIPTASSRSEETEDLQNWLEPWQKSELGSTHVLHIDEGGQPDKEDQQLLENATAIWFSGGRQDRLASRIVGTRWEELVVDILNRGGLVGGTSAGAAIQSKIMIARGNPIPEISQGLDLLPDAIVDQHFTQRERQGRLSQAILKNPDRFGLGIDEGTAV
ncbi:MAG: cyanophycinase, partial [Planctomycetota bacterium]|nr:cyanophycinase [Planctomycetota bacterium]